METSDMKITNNKYIDDVLYDSKFYFPHDFNRSKKQLRNVFISKTNYSIIAEYYNKYRKDLDSLQKKLRFEDFFRINHLLKNKNHKRLQEHLEIALLRVALRQCDEELNDEPIVLYETFVASIISQYRYSQNYVSLNKKDARSDNHDLVRRRMFHLLSRNEEGNIYFLKIHLENRCGIADVYEFNRDEINSHFLPIAQKFKLIQKFTETIEDKKVIHMTLTSEEAPKEKIMLNMVKHLNSLYMRGKKYFIEEK